MKRWVILAGLVLLASTAFAAETAEEASISGIMLEIRQSQGLPAGGRIDCDRVTPSQYERLGIAVMDREVQDTAARSWMDNMMGGPASEVTRAMHRMVGARYLGCPYGGRAGLLYGWPGMMGGGMMGSDYRRGADEWYGQRGGSATSWVLAGLVCILIIVLIVALATRSSGRAAGRTSLEVLRLRYAKGEITREQYEQMRKDMTD